MGYVTASHCSTKQGSVDGTKYYQPLNQVAGEFIGTEIADPAYKRSIAGCPKGRLCRYSDSNFSDGTTASTSSLARLPKQPGPTTARSTLPVNSSSWTREPLSLATCAEKVGRTTGWTRGTVTNTCVHTGVSGTNLVLLCQNFVEADVPIVQGGDSGSPVFRTLSGDSVALLGNLWGGNSSGTMFVYSPTANIEAELGPLTTH